MSNVVETNQSEHVDEQIPTDGLFNVWYDLNCGCLPSDWCCDPPGVPLAIALDRAAELRKNEWIVKVMPDDQNPRPDGRWDFLNT
ncbi:hypothetical protein R70006_06172 [Paraburkholderia domus]|uniref:hypothetical protein n=1 Tax=Paraburkholderia domus TaxID=2793075 RepID=UPI0019134200|nr:hypothetical protein [Paraburkholderia domus]MBK5052807.1 hypothetical protein [Burkholderia sp. R-70006]CAE6820431.1 hypothetical protein R70006_06172 [Paraburkholderia domus]